MVSENKGGLITVHNSFVAWSSVAHLATQALILMSQLSLYEISLDRRTIVETTFPPPFPALTLSLSSNHKATCIVIYPLLVFGFD